MKQSFLILFAIVLVLSGCNSHFSEIEEEDRSALAPGIASIDGFFEKEGRLPTSTEFHEGFRRRHISYNLLNKNSPYALAKGAIGERDYMLGVWTGEWNAYYQSWNGEYFNAYDEYDWPDGYGQWLELRVAPSSDSLMTQASIAELYLKMKRGPGVSIQSVWFIDSKTRTITVYSSNREPKVYSEGESITIPEISEKMSVDVVGLLPPVCSSKD